MSGVVARSPGVVSLRDGSSEEIACGGVRAAQMLREVFPPTLAGAGGLGGCDRQQANELNSRRRVRERPHSGLGNGHHAFNRRLTVPSGKLVPFSGGNSAVPGENVAPDHPKHIHGEPVVIHPEHKLLRDRSTPGTPQKMSSYRSALRRMRRPEPQMLHRPPEVPAPRRSATRQAAPSRPRRVAEGDRHPESLPTRPPRRAYRRPALRGRNRPTPALSTGTWCAPPSGMRP